MRRTRSSLGPLLGLLASMLAAMLILRMLPSDSEIWWLIIPVLGLAIFVGGALTFHWLVWRLAPSIARLWPASPTQSPPQAYCEDPILSYRIKPDLQYPPLALARSQCGWVAMHVRLRPDGSIQQYRIEQQTPGRTFETAVDRALFKVRFNIPDGTDLDLPYLSLITFLAAHSPSRMPAWARQRLPPEHQLPETAA